MTDEKKAPKRVTVSLDAAGFDAVCADQCTYAHDSFSRVSYVRADLYDQAIKERDEAKDQAEQLRVQLAGCGVAAQCNTRKAREQQYCAPGAYGWSQSYKDVLDAVGREIQHREENEQLQLSLQAAGKEIERLKSAVKWALGEGDDFPVRGLGDGAYWWRNKLHRLAVLEAKDPTLHQQLVAAAVDGIAQLKQARSGGSYALLLAAVSAVLERFSAAEKAAGRT